MWTRSQFGLAIVAIGVFAALLPGTASGQRQHADRPPQQSHPAQTPAPEHPQNRNKDVNRPPTNPQHQQGSANGNARAPQSHYAPQAGYNNAYRPNGGANLNPRQQVGIGAARPWVDTMRDLTPAQRERVLQNSRAFQNLSPDKQNKIRQQFTQWDHMTAAQRTDLRQKEQTWRQLTPGQRDYIKNDVLPRWRQMTWDRQQVMKQKLGVLQNMPESARNERLNDPNFTRGMSDDEKAMLRDLSHTHVGAPDPPNE
jgi:type IV secretory pathway VirB10-like protein